MERLTPEEEQKARESTPRGTFVLMALFAALMLAGWAYLFFMRFLEHGPVS
jgi:hypothetical protein